MSSSFPSAALMPCLLRKNHRASGSVRRLFMSYAPSPWMEARSSTSRIMCKRSAFDLLGFCCCAPTIQSHCCCLGVRRWGCFKVASLTHSRNSSSSKKEGRSS
ncbi:hypothetical protein M3J09_012022 [Ascochyta lentis]